MHNDAERRSRRAPGTRWAPALLVFLLAVAGGPGVGRAADFTVNPIQIFLGSQGQSAILTVQNTSSETLRFQLNVYAWSHDTTGQLRLSATNDIIFFPRLISLAPREQRIIRVGTTLPPGSVERTYRIFVEELPPLATQTMPPGQIRVLARMGIPIFVEPRSARTELRLGGLAASAGRVVFELRNTGTRHVVPQEIRARGLGTGGKTVWMRSPEGWYILAGEHRAYEIPLGHDDCARTRAVVVDVKAGEQVLSERLDVPVLSCAP